MLGEKPIHWYEGLFLRPQHFQQSDLFQERRLNDILRCANRYFWGLIELAFSRSRLDNQVFEIESCQLIMPDGNLIRYPGNAVVEPRSLAGHWDDSGAPLSVYLGLRHWASGENNISSEASEAGLEAKRFAKPEEVTGVPDLFEPDNKESVASLRYDLRLFIGGEADNSAGFDLIKVAEVQRFGNEVKVVEAYIPPYAVINQSPQLNKLLRELREQLVTRARELALYKEHQGQGQEMAPRELTYVLALRTLNRYVPSLYHLMDEQQTTPWQVYGLLRSMAAELSTFSRRYDLFGASIGQEGAAPLPVYDHLGLGVCFSRATQVITELLEEITAGPDFSAPLAYDGTYFYADLPDKVFAPGTRFYLCAKTSLPEDYVVPTFETVAKVASKEISPLLIARSLPGIKLSHLQSPPTVLPRRLHSFYFELDGGSEVWSSLKEGNNMAVYLDSPPADLELELMVVYG